MILYTENHINTEYEKAIDLLIFRFDFYLSDRNQYWYQCW